MNKQRIMRFFVVSVLLGVLVSCAPKEQSEPEGYRLWLLNGAETTYGAALGTRPWTGADEPTAHELMSALFAAPAQDGLVSPFPRGVSIQRLETDEEAGVLRLTLSEQYSGLSDMAQTLADACIAMTACQLPGIESVELSVDGFWATRPATRMLYPSEFETESRMPDGLP